MPKNPANPFHRLSSAHVNTDELGNLRLTSQEVDDIVAFMQSLTDCWSPASAR